VYYICPVFSIHSLFWKSKIGFWSHLAVCVFPASTFECLNQSGICTMAPEPNSMAYFINPCHQSCV
jgi:hypothetical protein